MQYQHMIERVRHWTGLPTNAAAARALVATTHALGTCLPAADRAHWTASLPVELRDVWQSATYRAHESADDVLAQISSAEPAPHSHAVEHGQAVIRVIASALAREDRDLLARHLPDVLAALVREPRLEEGAAPGGGDHDSSPAPRDNTLASGRPGSRTPLSTANPDAKPK